MALLAYWINPKGKVFELKGKLHIDYVIQYPKKFGETKDTIKNTYEKYKEPIGFEGKGREDIIKRVIKRGYIRIREYRDRWSIQLNKMTSKYSDIIWGWIKSIKNIVTDQYGDVIIYELLSNKITRTSINKLSEGTIIMNVINRRLLKEGDDAYPIVIVENIEDFEDYADIVNLNESSLSRIMTHINNKKTFGVISPFRKDNSKKENDIAYQNLIKLVKDMGYGYIEMKGGYQESTGFVNEKSLFIPNIKRNEIIDLGIKFEQDSVIHKNNTDFVEIGTNNITGIKKILSKFKTKGKNISVDDVNDKFTDFFSKLVKGSHRGKKFIFVSENQTGSSFVGSRIIQQNILTGEILTNL